MAGSDSLTPSAEGPFDGADMSAASSSCASVPFDEQGCCHMILTIGHRVEMIDKKQMRYSVFVRPDFDGCLDRVVFALEGTGLTLVTVPAPGPFEMTRVTQVVYASINIQVEAHFHPALKQDPVRKDHEVLLRVPSQQGKKGKAGTLPERTEDTMVLIKNPSFALLWGEHEVRSVPLPHASVFIVSWPLSPSPLSTRAHHCSPLLTTAHHRSPPLTTAHHH